MNYKARTLAKRPNAKLVKTTNDYGWHFYHVEDEAERLDDFGHPERGPTGAWRAAYYCAVRRERAVAEAIAERDAQLKTYNEERDRMDRGKN